MSTRRNKSRVWRSVVGTFAGAAMMLTSVPTAFAAPPTRPTRPGTVPPGGGTTPVQMSGDEMGLNPNSCRKWPANKKFTITIPREAELEQLVQWMMTISCQKFIWTNKIRASKVTILSPEKVTLREAYAAFYAALESIGLTIEPVGDYYKIVESASPAGLVLPTYGTDASGPRNDRYITQLYRLKNGDPKQISTALKKLKGKQGSIEVVGNLLIITDRGSAIRRMLKIVEELDQFGSGENIFFYQLQYADANEVADIVRDVFGEKNSKKSKSKKKSSSSSDPSFSRVIVDDRTGTLIIVASDSDYTTISRLIAKLDVRLPGGSGRVHVMKLKNADPKEVAQVLQTLIGRGGGKSSSKSKSKSGNKSASQGGAQAELFTGDINVVADEATRQLIIMASAADFKNIEAVVHKLDTERKQVYIEMYLLEVGVARLMNAGVGAHFANQPDALSTDQGNSTVFVGSSPAADASSLVLSSDLLSGLAAGLLGPQISGTSSILGLPSDIPAFGVVIHALETDDDVNVVAQPHIYTADNQEAQLEVGERVPTQGQLSFGGNQGGSAFFPTQSIQREDVTLEIKVTPHVNDERTVTLDVEIEDRAVKSRDPQLGVTTTKRRFKLDNVLARDDNPVVLGGLIRERETINNRQVPGLGSVPLLGWLFKRRERQKEKVNLLVVMIPHIIETPDDLRKVHERRMRERQAFLERETGFKKRDLETAVNYETKSGMLSTVDRQARKLEREEVALRQAEEELAQESLSGMIGLGVSQTGDADDDEGTGTPTRASKAKTVKTTKPAGRP